MWKKDVQGIESGKSRKIYTKIKAEIDTLETMKSTKRIREKLRNLKTLTKKPKKTIEKVWIFPK